MTATLSDSTPLRMGIASRVSASDSTPRRIRLRLAAQYIDDCGAGPVIKQGFSRVSREGAYLESRSRQRAAALPAGFTTQQRRAVDGAALALMTSGPRAARCRGGDR